MEIIYLKCSFLLRKMVETNKLGYKRIFGIILPEGVTDGMVRMVVGAIMTLVVMVFVLLLVVNPKKQDILGMQSKLEEGVKFLETLKRSRDGLDGLNVDLSEPEMENVLATMPTEYSPELAIYVLRQIAADTGVSIVSYSLPSGIIVESDDKKVAKQSSQMVDFLSYIVKITISSPVSAILSFISKVESSLPYGVVSDLNLQEVTKMTKSNSNNNVQLSLELKYFQTKINLINIGKIETITEKNLESSRKLAGYNLFTLKNDTSTQVKSATISGDLFGF